MPSRAHRNRVAAAFAQEKDAHYAVRLVAAIDTVVDFTLRPVISDGGYVQMVVLEASFDDPGLSDRLMTVMRGAHGVPVPLEVLDRAQAI